MYKILIVISFFGKPGGACTEVVDFGSREAAYDAVDRIVSANDRVEQTGVSYQTVPLF